MTCPNNRLAGQRIDNFNWKNYVRTINYNIPTLFKPTDLGDLVLILQMAESMNMEVKAVGSGWSIENLALSDNWVIDISELNNDLTNLIDIDRNFIHECVVESKREEHLDVEIDKSFVHVEAGIKVIDLNKFLESKGLSMITLGGAQGQTIAGAISTSTHGSDLNQPPLPDLIEAIHLVSENGQEYWIESSSNPFTHDDESLRSLLPCPDVIIIRDDDLFKSVQVSVGRFGVIYSYVVRVRKYFRTVEWANQLYWASVKVDLSLGISEGDLFGRLLTNLPDPSSSDVTLSEIGTPIYLDLTFNPRKNSRCWIRRRWITNNTSNLNLSQTSNSLCNPGAGAFIARYAGNALQVYAGVVAGIPFYGPIKASQIIARGAALQVLATTQPKPGVALAETVDAILASQNGNELSWLINNVNGLILNQSVGSSFSNPKRGPYWNVNSGTEESKFDSDCYNGSSIEIIFDTNDTKFITFIDTILSIGPTLSQLGYVSVRFSQPSQALISMHNLDSDFVVAIEVTSLHGMDDSVRWLDLLESLAVAQGGRLHWGQKNNLTQAQTINLYGENLEKWKTQLERIVGQSMRFSNAFTRQRGLEPSSGSREVTSVIRENGRITHLCNEASIWSPITIEQAMEQINASLFEYYIESQNRSKIPLIVRNFLTTTSDNDPTNNLRNQSLLNLSGFELPPLDQLELEINAIQIEGIDDIRYIGNSNENWAVPVELAQWEILLGIKTYYIQGTDNNRVQIEHRRFLATSPNEFISDNLEELPDC